MVQIPPRRYQWTGAAFEVIRNKQILENPWKPCPMCWGQRRIWHNTEARWMDCPTCLNIGEVPSI